MSGRGASAGQLPAASLTQVRESRAPSSFIVSFASNVEPSGHFESFFATGSTENINPPRFRLFVAQVPIGFDGAPAIRPEMKKTLPNAVDFTASTATSFFGLTFSPEAIAFVI